MTSNEVIAWRRNKKSHPKAAFFHRLSLIGLGKLTGAEKEGSFDGCVLVAV